MWRESTGKGKELGCGCGCVCARGGGFQGLKGWEVKSVEG